MISAVGRTIDFSLNNDENAVSMSQKNKQAPITNKNNDDLSFNENARPLSLGLKGASLGTKSISYSNVPKTPMISLNSTSKRRALGDISNRKREDGSYTLDTRKDKKLSKLNTQIKSSQTPFANNLGVQLPVRHDTKSIKPNAIKEQVNILTNQQIFTENASAFSNEKQFIDDDEIEKSAGRTWLEEREHVDDSYLSDGSLEFFNAHEMVEKMHESRAQRNIKEYERKIKELVEAHDKELEIFAQQSYSNDIFKDEAFSMAFKDESLELSKCDSESMFVFEDNWISALPTDDLSI